MTTQRRGNLPKAALTRFVGRRGDIAEGRRLIGRSRLVTLVGVGGVGKTRLAIEIGRESAKGFRDGVWFVDFAGVGDGGRIAWSVATTLQVPDQSTRPAEEQLGQFLADREVLLILDNCEHVIEDAALLAESLLDAAPSVRVLATSREGLGLAGEQIMPVLPLVGPSPNQCPPAAALESFDATAMFLDRARAVLPDFEATEANSADIVRLCHELDGLPLAIELAVSRLRTLDPKQILERLANRFDLLTGGSRTARSRQRTLRGLIAWSYDLCSAKQQLLWQRLSVFWGTFDLAAVEGVCDDEKMPRAELLDLLDSLVAQSVVIVEGRSAPEQISYRMLASIRAFGLDQLDNSGGRRDLKIRHRNYYLDLAERVAQAWTGPNQAEGLRALRKAHSNLLAALEFSTSSSEPDSAVSAHRLGIALRFHWCMDGYLSEGRHWLERILNVPVERPIYGRNLWVAGWVALLQGDQRTASTWLSDAEDIAEDIDDDLLRGQIRCMRGTAALFRGELQAAVDSYDAALAVFAKYDDDGEVLFTMFQLALALAHSGNPRAVSTARTAVELATRRGERLCRSYALWALGYTAWTKGELRSALRFTRAGLRLQRDYNDPVGSSLMLQLVACVVVSQGDVDRAGRLLGAIRSRWNAVGSSISSFGPHLAGDYANCRRQVIDAVRTERCEALMEEGADWDQPRALAEALGERPVPAANTVTGTGRVGPALTKREREVAELMARGLSNRAIATTLTVSPRTVDGHVENILAKLGFSSRTQVAAWVAGQVAGAAPG